jgi:uncharacterized SAM-binding protein YcdF (DUF218 family)
MRLVFVVLSAAGAAAVAGLVAVGLFLDRRRLPATPADAALVFGTGLEWKATTRWRTAARLYDEGRVTHLVVSGGVRMKQGTLTEAAWLAERLVEHGVPPDRIFPEDRATNTAENVEFSRPILEARGFTSVVLVMSDFEGIRAHLTAKRAWLGRGIAIFDCHARSTGHWHPLTWWTSREGWHLTWYTVSRLFRYRLLRYLRA